jgi:tripartite-type tricarboxylate transporter receptor subunit TctC
MNDIITLRWPRGLARVLVLVATSLAFATPAFAETKITRLIVAFAPGGPVDSVARILAEQLSKELGRTVIIENKPGANGAIGALEVARSDPDGSTLWITSVGAVAINQSLYGKLPYDMNRDFAPVSRVVDNVELLVVNMNNPAKTATEFVAAAKKSKEPFAMASSGIGSIPHLAIEELMDATGVKILHVPYKGAAPAISDLLGGHVEGFFGDVPGLMGQVRGKQLRALGVASDKRLPSLPDVPTLEEQGIKGVDTINWYALYAPIKTPSATIDALNQAVRNALANPGVRDKLLQTGTVPAPSTPQELAALTKHDADKWGKLIRAKNIKVE